MKKIVYFILLMLLTINASGQGLDSLMQSVKQNNPRLIALQKWLDAEAVKAKTGIYPENPHVEYYHLFGNSVTLGNQQEFEIMQSFRLPGYYTSKSDVQQLQYAQKQALVQQEIREMLHRVRLIYFKLAMLTKKENMLRERSRESEKLLSLMKEGFDSGEISKPAYDKARIYAVERNNEWQRTLVQIEINEARLEQLNGDHSIGHPEYAYPENWMLPSLEVLLSSLPEQNPQLEMAQLGISESEKQVRHQKMNKWPTFKAGYKYETILDQSLQGFHAGISVPLWQNANKVQSAKLQHEWSRAKHLQTESALRVSIRSLYNEAGSLFASYTQIRDIIAEEQLSENIFTLLQAGQISYMEYSVDSQYVWEMESSFLEMENEYYSKISELKAKVVF